MDAIQTLQESYSRVTLIPVVGSGISVPFRLPDWRTLIEKAAEHFRVSDADKKRMSDHLDAYEFVDAVDVILATGVEEPRLQQFVSDFMYAAKKGAPAAENNYRDLAKLEKLRYMTTNYDQYLNEIAGARSFRLEELEKMKINQFSYSAYDHTVIPLHGEISDPASIVLSRNSYQGLYDSERFREEFQQLRTHFTFLFLGFSFEDEYVQKLFHKVLQRFEAQHFILFEKSVQRDQPEKIERLREQYGIEALFYDASAEGHTRAISKWLEDIFHLSDPDVDLLSLAKLPKKEGPDREEQGRIDMGREYIKGERLGDLYSLYWPLYSSPDFAKHTVEYQIEILCGLLWYYGFLRKDEECLEMMDKALKDPVISKNKDKLALMHAQLLWNAREYQKGIQILGEYGKDNPLAKLLGDLLALYQIFLPERADVPGNIPVYGKEERSREEQERLAGEYGMLKERYINPETYNLKNLSAYEDQSSQYIAYYWLGVAAGQLFHQHGDAVQYLLRAYELEPLMAACEELAHNYFSLAAQGARYAENPKKYQLDMNALLKAKIRFQYLINFSGPDMQLGIFERSGFAYLQTLFWLKDFVSFYEFYERAGRYIPESEDLLCLKAEADAEYEHTVPEEGLGRLNHKERLFIQYYCVFRRAEVMAGLNPGEGMRLYGEMLSRADGEHPIEDGRIIRMVIDAAFFRKDIPYYEKLKRIYPEEVFEDFQSLGLEDELYGRVEEAGQKLAKMWSLHKDYDGTFQILKGFYVRNRKRKEYAQLMEELTDNPPGDMYRQPRFYGDRVMGEWNSWHDSWSALKLYGQYYDKFDGDMVLRKEVEEALKIRGADYGNYEDRVAWNRYMLTKAPKYARFDIYLSILKLYVANCKYIEAEQVLAEMKQQNIFAAENFDALVAVCRKPQSRRYYTGLKPYYSSDKTYLDRMVQEAGLSWRYRINCFGAKGQEIVLPVKYLLCMFRQNRQKELEQFPKVYLMYTGLINLQNSLWCREDVFLRMVLQWIEKSGNVALAAPDFRKLCSYAPNVYRRENKAEDIQLRLFCREHPGIIYPPENGW